MDRARLKSLRPGLLVGMVALVCTQLAIGSLWQSQHEAALERELSELRRETRRIEARLSREARSARVRAQRLRAGLARSQALVTSLRMEVADARANERQLRQRVESSSQALRDEPPPLGLRIAPDDPLSGLVAIADNAGKHPIRITESEGRLWIGEQEESLPLGESDLSVGPGEEIDLYEFPLLAQASGAVARGDLALRGALCLVYTRDVDTDPIEWAREIWFEYRPRTGGAALLHQDRWAPWPGEVPCDLTASNQPW